MKHNAMNGMTAEERAWQDSAGRALRESEQHLDVVTVARLRAARARAVASASAFSTPRFSWGLPMALAASVLAVLLVPRMTLVPDAPVNVAEVHALDVLTDEMGPEFYRNLDFYLWLEESGDSA